MSRSGMHEHEPGSREEQWAYICWRGAVSSSIRGKRGQAFIKGLAEALDAMPEKKLIEDELINDQGEVCAIGAYMEKQGIDSSKVDYYDFGAIAQMLGIAEKLVQEIEFQNDNTFARTPEARWQCMRDWCTENLASGEKND